MRVVHSLNTLLARRGVGYLGYVLYGVAWPKAAYRFGWGPAAPSALRFAFGAAVGPATTSLADLDAQTAASLLAEAGDSELKPPIREVEALMDRAHRAGVTGVRSGFDLVVRMKDGTARFTALPRARLHRGRGVLFAADRDRDRVAFNERFSAAVLTESTARVLLVDSRANVPAGYRDYAPIDFGGGITVGQVLSTDSGTGRWDFFNGPIVGPLVEGRRVLDLGSNNASMPLMMLRAGARSVTAIERSPAIANFARLNTQILAWRDIRTYDLRILTGDMRLFLDKDLGVFDVVTAFCSLYYVDEADMARLIEKAAAMGATLVLQGNEAINNLPARAADLRRLMTQHGYPNVEVHHARGYARPLLVGRGLSDTTAGSGERVVEGATLMEAEARA